MLSGVGLRGDLKGPAHPLSTTTPLAVGASFFSVMGSLTPDYLQTSTPRIHYIVI